MSAARYPLAASLAAGCLLALTAVSPCHAQSDNVTLLGHRDAYSHHSGCWGYASGGVELAIAGTQNGTTFVNATPPVAMNPAEAAFIPGISSFWREIRCYANHAYISNESGDGLAIVNLANPLAPTLVGNYTAAFSTCHSLHLDEAEGLLYCNGTNNGLVILDLANPESPTVAGTWFNFYVHDSYSRNGLAYFAAIGDGFLSIVDVSNLPAMTELSRIGTPDFAPHNVWLTADSQYALVTDETTSGHLSIYDVSDPENPSLTSEWFNPEDPNSSIHNVLVRGQNAYASWYTSGLQIFDVLLPNDPVRVGYYDTFPSPSGLYNGAWGVYCFAPSNNVYISDMSTGVYILGFTPGYATLKGTVTDSATGDSLANVSVTIPAASEVTTTDAAGFYRLIVDGGNYPVIYSTYGFTPDTIPTVLPDSSLVQQNVALVRLPSGSVTGTVRDLGTGLPISGADLTVESSPLAAGTNGAGSYSFPSVPAGLQTVMAAKFGYAPVEAVVNVQASQGSVQDFNLRPANFVDDFEINRGWTIGAPGDGASQGIWIRLDPNGTGGGAVQPEDDHTPGGTQCFVTGNGPPGGAVGGADVDGGRTTLLSPVVDLSALEQPILRYWRWYTNTGGPNPDADTMRVDVSNNGGASWVPLEILPHTRNFWELKEYDLATILPITNQMRVRFAASDFALASVVEAAVDDFEIYESSATASVGGELAAAARPFTSAPNPFRGETEMSFSLASDEPVLLDIFDVHGRRVARLVNTRLEGGAHTLRWDGRDAEGRKAPAGMYLARLVTGARTTTEKLMLMP